MAETAAAPRGLGQRIAAGDRSAEEEFAQQFSRRAFLLMLARTRDPDLSRDLAQDALIAALRELRAGRLRDPEKLPAFVLGVARHVLSSHFRAERRQPKAAPFDEAIDGALARSLAAAIAAPDAEISEQRQVARQALQVLDEEDRDILRLSLIEEWSAQRIGERIHLAGDAVRARKSRALRKVAARAHELSHPEPGGPHLIGA
jgi:RNA polymerase sigma-70 factor (ECF subfamily)